jgi:hypothetical protein
MERWTLVGTDHESTAQVDNSDPFVPERRDEVIGQLASSRAKVDRFFAQRDATLELNRCHLRAGRSIAGLADLSPPRPSMFVYHVAHDWPQPMVLWLHLLGGKLGFSSDLDGPYVLLAGISAVFLTASTLAFAAQRPFPQSRRDLWVIQRERH